MAKSRNSNDEITPELRSKIALEEILAFQSILKDYGRLLEAVGKL